MDGPITLQRLHHISDHKSVGPNPHCRLTRLYMAAPAKSIPCSWRKMQLCKGALSPTTAVQRGHMWGQARAAAASREGESSTAAPAVNVRENVRRRILQTCTSAATGTQGVLLDRRMHASMISRQGRKPAERCSAVAKGAEGDTRANQGEEEADVLIESWPDQEGQSRLDRLAELALQVDDDEGWDLGLAGQDAGGDVPEGTGEAPRGRRGARGGRQTEDLTPMHLLPKVAIVGRPNVGKSALFNRIAGNNLAIIYDYPGVTRDRLYTRASWGASEFVLVDTGGLMSEAVQLPGSAAAAAAKAISAAGLPQAIERQAAAGVKEANTVVMVVDGQEGLTASDSEILTWLRRSHPDKPVLLAVNKCENVQKADLLASEFWALGVEPVPVSAISGSGTGDLMDRLVATLPPPVASEGADLADKDPLPVAIIGRPNVGKSSLLNALVGEERAIVSPISGTTRDAIDMDVVLPDGRTFKLIDTAGIRKRTAVADSKDGAEPLSVKRAMMAIRRSEVVALVIDAVEATSSGVFTIAQQDFRLAELVAAEGKACVIVVNKWDAVQGKDSNTMMEYEKEVLAQLRPLSWASVVFTSATTGRRVEKILDSVSAAGAEHRRRISTATLNMVLRETLNWRAPPSSRGSTKKGRIYYATQAATRPPSFVFFVNDAKLFPDDYKKYMERQLRENIGFPGTPLRLFWRSKGLAKKGRQSSSLVSQV
eukprot:jgi/Botrbrau1/99/Bobra.0022s0088.2